MVNLGCIDINPWTSGIKNPTSPDYIIIDLDPSDDDFNKAVLTAMAAREYFKKKKITSFVKTSGKTGIHLYLPCSGFNFEQARDIAEIICSDINGLVPSITTTNISINTRGNKLYIDPNQNDYADTVAAPYSVRPFHLPTVSTPLDWKEVKPGLKAEDFLIQNIHKRVKKKGDLFKGIDDQKIRAKNTVILRNFLIS
jgi:bifunctional non-homologous end joining protein LigD